MSRVGGQDGPLGEVELGEAFEDKVERERLALREELHRDGDLEPHRNEGIVEVQPRESRSGRLVELGHGRYEREQDDRVHRDQVGQEAPGADCLRDKDGARCRDQDRRERAVRRLRLGLVDRSQGALRGVHRGSRDDRGKEERLRDADRDELAEEHERPLALDAKLVACIGNNRRSAFETRKDIRGERTETNLQ